MEREKARAKAKARERDRDIYSERERARESVCVYAPKPLLVAWHLPIPWAPDRATMSLCVFV